MEHITAITKLRNDMAAEFAAGHERVTIGPKRGEELTAAINHLLGELESRAKTQKGLETSVELKDDQIGRLQADLASNEAKNNRLEDELKKANDANGELRTINTQTREQLAGLEERLRKLTPPVEAPVDPAPAAEPASQT